MITWRKLPIAFGANAFAISVGWARILCQRVLPLTLLPRDLQLSKNCQRMRYATCGSWARYALPTLRSLGLTIPPTVMVRVDRVSE
jgi:hypothetical protein